MSTTLTPETPREAPDSPSDSPLGREAGTSPSATPGVRRVRRLPLKLLGLLAVIGLLVPVAAAVERFEVVADGQTTSLTQFSGTVGDVLDEQGIVLDEGDEVTQPLATPVTDGMVIEVVRADDFTVVVDGDEVDVVAIADDIAAVVRAAGVGDVSEAFVQPTLSTPAVDGTVVNIVRKVQYTVLADGREIPVESLPGTVGEVLVGAGITVDADDDLSAAISSRAIPEIPVKVTRIETVSETEEVTVPNETVRRETSDRFVGEEVVATSGSDGVQVDTYEVRLVDGVEDTRELVSSEVTTEPVDRVIEIGTAARPAPKPEPRPEPKPEPRPEPAPEPAPASSSSPSSSSSSSSSSTTPSAPAVPSGSVWDRLAQCESGGNWSLNVGTYDGGLQFHPSTWNSWKKSSYPEYAWQATRAQQIEAATRLQAALGWGQWPACSSKLGLR